MSEIEKLRAEVERLREMCKKQSGIISRMKAKEEENSRLYRALYRIAGRVPFADDPWTIARNALEKDGR
jgi:SMC interacting uncharacterized protein involved in chromosome segregation